MILQNIETLLQKENRTILEISAVDTEDSIIKDTFPLVIELGEGPELDEVRNTIKDEFHKRYHNKDSLFYTPTKFVDIVNAAYIMRHPTFPASPVICGLRNRLNLDNSQARLLPFSIEFDICREPNLPVVLTFTKVSAWQPLSPAQEIVTTINPVGIEWDVTTGKFMNHPDADFWNARVEEYRQNFMASVNEELHEELALIELAEAEERYDQDQIEGGEECIISQK